MINRLRVLVPATSAWGRRARFITGKTTTKHTPTAATAADIDDDDGDDAKVPSAKCQQTHTHTNAHTHTRSSPRQQGLGQIYRPAACDIRSLVVAALLLLLVVRVAQLAYWLPGWLTAATHQAPDDIQAWPTERPTDDNWPMENV